MLYGLAAADGVAARALAGLGVDAAAVERETGRGGSASGTSPGPPRPADEKAGDAEALAVIGIDLDEIKRRIEKSLEPERLTASR